MKHVLAITLLFALILIQAPAQTISTTYPGYSLTMSAGLADNPDAGFLPFVSAKLDTLPRAKSDSRFGILFRGADRTETIFTFLNASTGAPIQAFSIDSYYGSAAEGIEPLPARSTVTDSSRTDAFRITQEGLSFTALRTISRVQDLSMPLGMLLTLDWSVESPTDIRLRMELSGTVEGDATASGNALIFRPAPQPGSFRPEVVLVGQTDAEARVIPAGDTEPARVILTGPVVNVSADRQTSVFNMALFGTTVSQPEHIAQQSANVIARLSGAAPAANMITRIISDRTNVLPGDTITYRILFHNIGTGPATRLALSNPIRKGLTYVAGSVTGEDTEIVIERTNPEPPQAPVVEGITWTFLSNILPGEERWVSFKAIVQ